MIGDSFAAKDAGIQKLAAAQNEFRPAGIALAEADRAYSVVKATLILKLRDEGQPATIIPDLVKGDVDVARLKLERDIAEVNYKAVQSQINTLKLELRLINDDINREWNSGGIGEIA